MQKSSFANNWSRNYQELSPTGHVPNPHNYKIEGWAINSQYKDIWIPYINENTPDKRNFYCSVCDKWLIYGDTMSNIRRHLKTHSSIDQIINAESSGNSQENKDKQVSESQISQYLTKFILMNGLPFRLIEDENLKLISSNLKNRKALSQYCQTVSSKIVDLITKELNHFKFICISIDEWKDKALRSYLGVTAQAVSNNRLSFYTLGMKPIIVETISGEVIHQTLKEVLDPYRIEEKIIGCVTDSGSNMILGISKFPFQRLPCTCHLFNNLLRAFIVSHKKCFQDLENLQNECSTSKFRAYCVSKNAPCKSIPSYCQVRWYSMCRLIDGLFRNKHTIIEFRTKYGIEAVSPLLWEDIDILNPVFKKAKEIIQILESDSFGTISYVLRAFSIFKNSIALLPEKFEDGKIAVEKKFQRFSVKYDHLWNPLLFSACRLNPAMNVHLIMDSEDIIKGDELILSLMKNESPSIIVDSSSKTHNSLLCYSDSPQDSNETAFEYYKTIQLNEIVDLYEFWRNKLDGRLKVLANVAIRILSIMCTSASVEREFSSSRRALGFQRLKMDP